MELNLKIKDMVQESFYSTTLKSVVKRIDKRIAEKMFSKGETIYLMPSNMIFDGIWQTPCPIEKDSESTQWISGGNFATICNYFRYYNCDAERGKYIKFYIKEK